MAAVDGVKRAPEQGSGTEDRAHRQQPHDPDHRLDGGVLQAVPEAVAADQANGVSRVEATVRGNTVRGNK